MRDVPGPGTVAARPRVLAAPPASAEDGLVRVLVAVDRWLHRVMRGRCWCPWICLKLEYYQAMKDEEKHEQEEERQDPR